MWQRDALRRLFEKGNDLSDADYAELYELFKKENAIENNVTITPIPLERKHIPTKPDPDEIVKLVALRELNNVNRIPSDQCLKFAPSGITLIYGNNATGKSGFARVIKKACRARDSSEKILPDATVSCVGNRVPSAKFKIVATEGEEEIGWTQGLPTSDKLSKISVFDSRCARSYLSEEKEPFYLPYGLDILTHLADKVLPSISKKRKSDIEKIDTNKAAFAHLEGDTAVGEEIKKLSADTDPEAIRQLGKITEDDTKRIEILRDSLAKFDHSAEANKLNQSAMRLKKYAADLDKAAGCVGDESVHGLRELVDKRDGAINVEANVACALHSDKEILPGTGEDFWKQMFEAARRYADEIAYHGKTFPPSTEGSRCPLCQQPLGKEGILRLQRFDKYVQQDAAKVADAMRNRVSERIKQLETASLEIRPDNALRQELSELDPNILSLIEDYQSCINSRRLSMLECVKTSAWEDIPPFVDHPKLTIRRLAAAIRGKERTMRHASKEGSRDRLQKELNELCARQQLEASMPALIEMVERMKRRSKFEKCKKSDLNPKLISMKIKSLASDAATQELEEELNRELEYLGVGYIQAEVEGWVEQGTPYQRLRLKFPSGSDPNDILSEGEQRVMALGAFLAELSLANHSCGIVFDDPVSSLDYWYRESIAQRLVEEARHRQVAVFTHDVFFLQMLVDVIDVPDIDIPSLFLFLEHSGECPGYVRDGLPWEHQGYKKEMESIKRKQKQLDKKYSIHPDGDYRRETQKLYKSLRTAIELVVQQLVFGGIMDQYDGRVKVGNLHMVKYLEKSESDVLINIHRRCSKIGGVHPASPLLRSTPPPTIQKLKQDIDALEAIINQVKNRNRGSS